jgi:hypothetical protein
MEKSQVIFFTTSYFFYYKLFFLLQVTCHGAMVSIFGEYFLDGEYFFYGAGAMVSIFWT